jgi:glycosyltransferase involved in cell wall biosynthesis
MSKILYVTDGVAPHVVGGVQAAARRHIEWLSQAGHDVLAVHSNMPAGVVPDWPGQSLHIDWPKRGWASSIDPWRYVRDLQRYSRKVVDAARDFDPDVVYSEGPFLHAYLQLTRRAPVIFHPHGLEMFQPKGSITEDLKSLPLRAIMRAHARKADVVLCYGGDLGRLLEHKLGAAPQRIRFLPNTYRRPDWREQVPRSRRRGRLLMVARDEKRKGLGVLLKVMEKLPQAHLTVVGIEGALQGRDNVSFLGVVRDRVRLDALFDEAELLIVPSFAEGMPTVVLEALAAGLPIIASDVGAVREAVIEGRTGFLLRPGDVEQLKGAIARGLALSEEDYSAMRAACGQVYKEKFAPDRVKEMLLGIIASTL